MPVKYGFIGCGAIAQRRHLPEAAANSHSKVAALADRHLDMDEGVGRVAVGNAVMLDDMDAGADAAQREDAGR